MRASLHSWGLGHLPQNFSSDTGTLYLINKRLGEMSGLPIKVFPSTIEKFHVIYLAFSNPPHGDPLYGDSIAKFFFQDTTIFRICNNPVEVLQKEAFQIFHKIFVNCKLHNLWWLNVSCLYNNL